MVALWTLFIVYYNFWIPSIRPCEGRWSHAEIATAYYLRPELGKHDVSRQFLNCLIAKFILREKGEDPQLNCSHCSEHVNGYLPSCTFNVILCLKFFDNSDWENF